MREVVVVGGGLAGCWAAVTAAAAGAHVTLVRRGPAATAVSSGAFDFVPPAEADDPDAWLRRLPREDPLHPYMASGEPPSAAALDEEAARLGAALGDAGLPCRRSLLRPALVASVGAEVRSAGMLAASAAAGDLRALRRPAVAAVRGLRRLDASLVADAVAARTGGATTAVSVAVAGVPDDIAEDLDDATCARLLEAPGGAEALGDALRRTLDGSGAVDGVLLPAVLGLGDATSVAARVAAVAGVPVAELLTPPPSVPGWRLHRALERMVASAGVDLVTGAVARVAVEDGVATAVEAAGGERIACEVLVLATGKFVGGGVGGSVGRAGLHESLLDLPLEVRGHPADALTYRDMIDRTGFADQPFLEAGVRVDGSARPVDRFGIPVYGNVLACGALLSGMAATLRSGGLGVVAWTGARAGRAAATLAGAAT